MASPLDEADAILNPKTDPLAEIEPILNPPAEPQSAFGRFRNWAIEQNRQGQAAAEAIGAQPKQAESEVLQGASRSIANMIGFAPEVANEILNHAGRLVAGKPAGFLDRPGNAQATVRAAFRRAGINAPEEQLDTWAFKIGEMLPSALAGAGGLLLAAPRLAAAGGTGAFAESARQIGRAAQAFPGVTVATDIAAVPGAVVGGDLAQSGGEALFGKGTAGAAGARVLGELVGGGLTGGTLAWMNAKARTPMRQRLAREGQLTAIHDYADDAVRHETEMMDQHVRRVVANAADSNLTPEQAYQRFVTGVEGLDQAWRGRQRLLYDATPNVTHDVTELHQLAMQIEAAHGMRPANRPSEQIRTFRGQVEVPTGIPNTIQLREATTRELMEWRSDLLEQMRIAKGSRITNTPPNNTLHRNLDMLQRKVLETIDARLRNDPDWIAAREFSLAYHDRFTRGPIAEILEATRRGEYVRNPQEMFKQILSDPEGLPALREASSAVIGGGGRIIMPPTRSGMQATRATDEAIRAHYQRTIEDVADVADLRGPGRYERAAGVTAGVFNRQHERVIAPYQRASTQLQVVAQDLSDTLAAKAAWADGVLARFTKVKPEAAISKMLRAPNPSREAMQFLGDIARTQTRNPTVAREAREAWEYQMVRGFLELDGRSAIEKAARMQDPRWQGLFDVVLGSPARRQHMTDLINAAARLERGETHIGTRPSMAGRALKATFPWMGQVVGLHLGHAIVRSFFSGSARGPASLSVPSRMGKAMRELAAKAFRSEATADILTQAIIDPPTASVLLRNLPDTPEAAAATARRMMAISRRINVGLDESNNRLFEEGRREEQQRQQNYNPKRATGPVGAPMQLTAPDFITTAETMRGVQELRPDGFSVTPRESTMVEDRRGQPPFAGMSSPPPGPVEKPRTPFGKFLEWSAGE